MSPRPPSRRRSEWKRHALAREDRSYFTEERLMMQSLARTFTREEVMPLANRLDPEKGDIPRELVHRMGDLGFFGILIPEEFGGLGLGAFEYCVVAEELAHGWMSVASIIARGNNFYRAIGGQDQVRRAKIEAMARGRYLGAAALSEPQTGSDLSNVACRARRDGDEWVITGNKYWCIRIFQNGDEAGFNWNYGGRLYSQPAATNYQQMSKKARLKMTFNGEAVAEIDIRASYLTLYYGWFGRQLDFNTDPYLLPDFGQAGRDAVKLWMVATFGSPKPISKWPAALLKEYEEDHHEKFDQKRYPVKLVREKALLQHPLMARWGELRKGRNRTWADLMYYESVVMVSTMVDLMRDHGIPSLAVHDSLIVPRSAINTTATVLRARFRSVTKQDVQLTFKPKGLMVS
jgi:hypothetical protein